MENIRKLLSACVLFLLMGGAFVGNAQVNNFHKMQIRLLGSQSTIQSNTATILSNSPRKKQNFNCDWKFQLGDFDGAAKIGFDDSKWQNVGLPHSFSIPYFMSSDFYVGYGWYRKHFSLTAIAIQKKLFVEFEAAFQDAEVFVNNQRIGEHKGGYTGFSMDISKAVRPGDNLIAVRVNNLWNARLAPRAGEHTFSGGIYRDVYLVSTESVHVDWCGTFVTSTLVSEKEAKVNVKTDVKNDGASDRIIIVKTELFDPAGKLVATISSKKTVPSGSEVSIEQTSLIIKNPKLWHLDHPYLYIAKTTLLDGNKKVDEYKTTFGIRTLKWTADKGLFLNGEHIYLRGANVHQDHAGWGDAVANSGFYNDVKMMKDAGFNFIRGSHYPHDPAFVEACDKLGMLFWSENPFWGIGGSGNVPDGYWNTSAYPVKEEDRAAFEAGSIQQLQEMIKIHRNSPSVVVWSMSNEPFFTANHTIPNMREFLKKLVAASHNADSTRMAAIGGAQRPLDNFRIDKIGDVAGYNGDGGTLSVFQNPGVPNVVSEYGSTTADRPGKYEPGWGDLSKVRGEAVYDWRSGQAIWCGFDHGSIAGANLGKMGVVDYFRIPKRAWYWYRNEYRHIAPPAWPQPGIPAKLKLAADRIFAATDGTEDIKLTVTVLDGKGNAISNNPPVELSVVSGPAEFPTGNSIKFEEKSDIRILDGQAAIECRAWYAGKSVIRATSPGLESSEIKLEFKGGNPYLEGKTPKTPQRSYVRFTKKDQLKVLQTFGQNNPTFGSSAMKEHLTGYAADGNKNTWWQPLANDSILSWTLDTEKRLSVTNVNIIFPTDDVYQYKVELLDNQSWIAIADSMNNQQKEISSQIKVPEVKGRMLRITFRNASKAKLAEVEVMGKVLD